MVRLFRIEQSLDIPSYLLFIGATFNCLNVTPIKMIQVDRSLKEQMADTLILSVVGPKGVGKSTYINRIANGEFAQVTTSHSYMNLDDTHVCLVDGYVDDCYGVIYMTDATNVDSWQHIPIYPKPTIIAANKMDLACINKEFMIKAAKGMHIILMSAKSNYNFDKPITYFIELRDN